MILHCFFGMILCDLGQVMVWKLKYMYSNYVGHILTSFFLGRAISALPFEAAGFAAENLSEDNISTFTNGANFGGNVMSQFSGRINENGDRRVQWSFKVYCSILSTRLFSC